LKAAARRPSAAGAARPAIPALHRIAAPLRRPRRYLARSGSPFNVEEPMIRQRLPRGALPGTVLAMFMLVAAEAAAAPEPIGRWQGVAEIPGAPMPLIVDIARDGARQWIGSVTLPGRGVKGAPIDGLEVSESGLRMGLVAAFPGAPGPVVEARVSWRADGSLAGELHQGGHAAPLVLRRSGEAQVDVPERSTPVSAALAGTWVGRYELDGYPRDVTLKLANGANGIATGKLVVVGRRTTTLVLDHVVQGAQFIALKASAADFRIEGRWSDADGTIRGQMQQGPFEAPLVLRRAGAAAEEKKP
jgi:hypothetical protein